MVTNEAMLQEKGTKDNDDNDHPHYAGDAAICYYGKVYDYVISVEMGRMMMWLAMKNGRMKMATMWLGIEHCNLTIVIHSWKWLYDDGDVISYG